MYTSLLNGSYRACTELRLLETQRVPFVSLTSDGWTSGGPQLGLLGFTAHFIDSTFRLRSCDLTLVPMNDSHTTTNILDTVREVVSTFFPLDSTLFGFMVTDGASNFIGARSGFSAKVSIATVTAFNSL